MGRILLRLRRVVPGVVRVLRTTEAQSWIRHSTIENATYGIRIAGRLAPGIEKVALNDITSNREVYLDGMDTVVPGYRYEDDGNSMTWDYFPEVTTWDLVAPTTVMATNTVGTGGDAAFGTAGKLDLVFQGKGFTSSGSPSTDSVTFRPESITSPSSTDAGNDWGGITFDSYSAGSVLECADVGYASNPVFVFYPDSSTTIRDSRIHHFASTGLWIYGSIGVGGDVSGTVIDRGPDLHESLGSVGVFFDKVTNFRFGSSGGPNLVLLQGASDGAGGFGIAGSLGKTLCLSTGGGVDDLLRIGNTTIVGPGMSASGDWSGVRLNWICGSSNRAVEIEANWIEGCNFAGLDLEQVVDEPGLRGHGAGRSVSRQHVRTSRLRRPRCCGDELCAQGEDGSGVVFERQRKERAEGLGHGCEVHRERRARNGRPERNEQLLVSRRHRRLDVLGPATPGGG